ncbi:DnaJ domain-containing protein [Desulfosarcina sp. OttesenSCG-928-G17]|nr:DnaJ domain-containing protein [Desulfosarcina sp. OttesenSCG-928-G17]
MLNLDNIIFLGVIYLLSYGVGFFVSKLWKWLRVLIVSLVAISTLSSINNLDFEYVSSLRVFLIIIIPMCIFAYPTLAKSFPAFSIFLNPFSWVFEKISEFRYRGRRRAEQKRDNEDLERIERIVRMQAEEAERQRQFEREKAEREARERAEYWKQQKGSQNSESNNKEERANSKTHNTTTSQDPYEVLGVTRDMSKKEIQKAYRKLMQEYAPDHVAHLSKEFQKMAHEKCVAFNLAWEKIQKEK